MANELVLVIEDNEKNRRLALDILQFHGYRTLESDTAEEGLRLAQQCQPALILMDIQLPGMSGLDALAALRAHPKTTAIPVMAITASVMTQDRDKIIAAGFDGYQRKPIDLKRFVEVVAELVSLRSSPASGP